MDTEKSSNIDSPIISYAGAHLSCCRQILLGIDISNNEAYAGFYHNKHPDFFETDSTYYQIRTIEHPRRLVAEGDAASIMRVILKHGVPSERNIESLELGKCDVLKCVLIKSESAPDFFLSEEPLKFAVSRIDGDVTHIVHVRALAFATTKQHMKSLQDKHIAPVAIRPDDNVMQDFVRKSMIPSPPVRFADSEMFGFQLNKSGVHVISPHGERIHLPDVVRQKAERAASLILHHVDKIPECEIATSTAIAKKNEGEFKYEKISLRNHIFDVYIPKDKGELLHPFYY